MNNWLLKRRWLLPGLILIVAVLACTIGDEITPQDAQEETAPTELPTVTPTHLPPPPTPLPTVTEIPSASPPAACPAPDESVTLPDDPPALAEYYTTFQDYLTQGGTLEKLGDYLRSWGSITKNEGYIGRADLTGDSIPEVIITAQAAPDQFNEVFPPGDLYIYTCSDGGYDLLHADFSDPVRRVPEVIAVQDLNGNGQIELAYTTSVCGASTCNYMMYIMEYDAESGELVDLLDEYQGTTITDNSGLPYSDLIIEDEDSDNVRIIIDVGGYGSAGAGPQRLYHNTFEWGDGQYELVESEITSTSWPIHLIHDADASAEAGDYEQARDTYERLLSDDAYVDEDGHPLFWFDDPDVEKEILQRYAHFRLMQVYLLLNNEPEALFAYQAAMEGADIDAVTDSSTEEFLSPLDDPLTQAGFAILADLFWNEYGISYDIESACQMVIGYARDFPETYQILNMYGYANRQYDPEDLCFTPQPE